MRAFVFGLLFLVVGCGKTANLFPQAPEYTVERASAEQYNYQLMGDDGCTTGEHYFDTLKQTCQGLKNEDKNNHCAFDERRKLFYNHGCDGDFTV